ncbi:MAG: choice-of-anchor B family protein [Bacteroidota bacterium]
MKKLILLLLIPYFSFSQTLCESGYAGSYPCDNIDLQVFLPNALFGASEGNDSWGWTDPTTNKEYAIYCNTHNTAFIDITDPVNPIYLGKLNSHTSSSIWRDAKVYNDHVFIVSEASGHGMQVFDLTRLRNVTSPPEMFTEDAHESSFGHAHNIAINEATGYAYIIGASPYNGGPIFINIQDPLNPVNEGGYGSEGYSHDAQIVVYNGPDTEHVGKEIYFGPNETSIVIVDVTDKANPVTLSESFYSGAQYTHQLWVDENHEYLYANDELDEYYNGGNTRNIVFDISDLDNPALHMEYYGPTTAIDHNNYVVGDKLYIANYRAGLRIVDISDVVNNNMTEIAYFDTYPANNNANFDGAWSVYPYFGSKNIVISDINSGFFVVKEHDDTSSVTEYELNLLSLSPNPTDDFLTIQLSEENFKNVTVYNMLGKKILEVDNLSVLNQYDLNVDSLDKGVYTLVVNNYLVKSFIKK